MTEIQAAIYAEIWYQAEYVGENKVSCNIKDISWTKRREKHVV